VSLPRHLLELLDPGRKEPPEPRPNPWRTLYPGNVPGAALPIVELNYDFDLPPWNAGPYREDIPK
jgi:hypothetical protein